VTENTIGTFKDEINRVLKQEIDVMSMENRAYLLSRGYMSIGESKIDVHQIGIKSLAEVNKRMALTYS